MCPLGVFPDECELIWLSVTWAPETVSLVSQQCLGGLTHHSQLKRHKHSTLLFSHPVAGGQLFFLLKICHRACNQAKCFKFILKEQEILKNAGKCEMLFL